MGGAAQVERANARVPSEQRGRGRAEQERCLPDIACPLRDLNVVDLAILNENYLGSENR